MSDYRIAFMDIDGVVADEHHRRHYISDGRKQWGSYLNPDEMEKDSLIQDGKDLYDSLYDLGFDIVWFTGRPVRCHDVTHRFLTRHGLMDNPWPLIMRAGTRPSQVDFKILVLERYRMEIESASEVRVYDDNLAVVEAANRQWRFEPQFKAIQVQWAQDIVTNQE